MIDDYLCLTGEVIEHLTPPETSGEVVIVSGCGIDHEHRFFSERITSSPVLIETSEQYTVEMFNGICSEDEISNISPKTITNVSISDIEHKEISLMYFNGIGWTSNHNVDRVSFNFDGRVSISKGYIYFGYDQRILAFFSNENPYSNESFRTMTDEEYACFAKFANASESEKITYMTCDWPYYDTPQSLYEAATDIFEGKVSNIFFKIIDMRSGKVVDDKEVDGKTYLRLYTVYEIDVTDSYKKAESNKMYVCVSTGFEGYKEAEQRDLMKSVGIYNENIGIQVIREFEHLQIGQSYLFLTVDLGGTYNYIVNADQFAFAENSDKESGAFGYTDIKKYVELQR